MCMGLALTACSGTQDAEAAGLGSPGSLAGGSPTSPGPGDPAGDREVPASCAALTLAPGAALDGAGLGECVS